MAANPRFSGGDTVSAGLDDDYFAIRRATEALCDPLDPEDMVVQSMPDCSPAKWHLAHTTWFFENMVLGTATTPRAYDPHYVRLFNSYYRLDPPPHPRHARGLLSRPTVREIIAYRRHVDTAVLDLLRSGPVQPAQRHRVLVGLHHEQQHQELLLTDILHLFSQNPTGPVYRPLPAARATVAATSPVSFQHFDGGRVRIGAREGHFSFDNERPVHERVVPPFSLGRRLVTNAEFGAFMRDGGYRRQEFWLAAGWEAIQANGTKRPLYWCEDPGQQFTLGGFRALEPSAPVAHVSYFEADAFARWSGARLPREEEWEAAAAEQPVSGNLLDEGSLTPLPSGATGGPVAQLFGDVWEWTQSPYAAYPGFKPEPPPLDEYNGQFMVNQMVLRGGSCLSPAAHVRATYRNFLPPSARWQVSGIRLARDA